MKFLLDQSQYNAVARQLAAEGCVLLRNEDCTLPLKSGNRIAVFGRAQASYYKSGTGSGGMVNTLPVVSLIDALSREESLTIDETVKSIYDNWIEIHPFDHGIGWASEPWYQQEMPLDASIVTSAAQRNDCAIVIIGRTAGEDQDNSASEGSYYLTAEEMKMMEVVCETFDHTIVLLNVGNVIDMNWVETCKPSAVVYLWEGGEHGALAACDILTGRTTPSGKLPDTIAWNINDYPAADHYGDPDCTPYTEDIYVGYRYFETFCPEKIQYPFGFGLSYTTFSVSSEKISYENDRVCITVSVCNTGNYCGKEVIGIYCSAPQGKLGKPSKVLCGFVKTKLLEPGETDTYDISFSHYVFSSFCDVDLDGVCNAYVLEPGEYAFLIGSDVRKTIQAGTITIDSLIVVDQLTQALAPVKAFDRIYPKNENGCYLVDYEPAPLRSINLAARIDENLPKEIQFTGPKGIKLCDVAENRSSMTDFIAQLTDEDLCCIVRGEGMCSPKVTPGTAGAFGAVTDELQSLGIPIACCADGPGGIRMDCGTIATALPSGTCIAATFNPAFTEELFMFLGAELRKNKIDSILGPGMNLHRHILNGRNFEYFSEDPLLTGKMAAAELRGLHACGVTGTIKHFACNDQEYRRHFVDAVVSARAVRELYLKGFEIAVKEGGAYNIMSSYNLINGVHAASNYDLLTTILRGEWGYDGLVMTDWWARGNFEGEDSSITHMGAQIRAQNDLYMVSRDVKGNANGDDSAEMLASGRVTRGEYQRSAANILRSLIRTPAFARLCEKTDELDSAISELPQSGAGLGGEAITVDAESGFCSLDCKPIASGSAGTVLYQIRSKTPGTWLLKLQVRISAKSELAQTALSIFNNRELIKTISLSGAENDAQTYTLSICEERHPSFYVRFYALGGMEILEATLTREENV